MWVEYREDYLRQAESIVLVTQSPIRIFKLTKKNNNTIVDSKGIGTTVACKITLSNYEHRKRNPWECNKMAQYEMNRIYVRVVIYWYR